MYSQTYHQHQSTCMYGKELVSEYLLYQWNVHIDNNKMRQKMKKRERDENAYVKFSFCKRYLSAVYRNVPL